MKKQLLLLCVISFCLLLYTHIAFAQQNTFKPFFEKVYVQTDREYYTSGEDVWYKAYLVNAQSNYPTSTSNNLYVELITSDASIINRQVVYLKNGAGNGDFRLADSLPAGLYKLRAYTSWMKNFGDNFIFEKSLRVGAAGGSTTKKQATTTTQKNAQTEAGYRLQFFPEGGSIIANVSNVIAFKAEDAAGKAASCEGSVIDSKGKTVATFKSSYAGMGSFSLTPRENEFYQVKAVCNTQTVNSDLPIALEKGFALSITSIDTATYIATIKTNDATLASLRNTMLTLGGKHAGKLYFEDSVRLMAKEVTIKIPARLFPQGVAVMTLYDAKLRPNNERLVFVDRSPEAVLSVQLNKTSLNANENPVATLQVAFPTNKPAAANLSMAVVDAGIVPVAAQNIVNYLLLQSDIKGKIENADNYFDAKNPKRLEQLDLLLLTQGWREFVWTKLAQEGIRIKYMPEPGITISGMVRRGEGGKPLPDANVTLFAPQAKGDKLLFTKTDTSGHYYVDGVYLFGPQRIKLTSKDEKGKPLGFISMDSLFRNPLAATKFDAPADTSASFQQFAVKAAANLVTLNKIKDEALKELPGVIVTAKESRTMVTRNDVITRFGYKDSTFSPTDADLKDYGDLENYLHHKMPGAMEDVDNGGLYFLGESSFGSGQVHLRPTFFVDNREDMFERMDYYQLPVNQISKIVIKHGISAMTNQHVYQIHLTLKPDAMNKPDFISTEITGYYEARNFYVPQAKMESESTNFLTTVYWVPVIKTSESGFARITIDNQKKKGVCRVVVEGLTENGVPLYSVVNYQAK